MKQRCGWGRVSESAQEANKFLRTVGHKNYKIRKEIMTTIFSKITSDGLEGMGTGKRAGKVRRHLK